MKKILFILFLFAAFQSFGQNRFPSIDSAKNYTLRYYRNSTVETFTNLRGQNIAYGTLELIDSLAGNGAIDSIWFTGGTPDTLRYRKAGTTFTVGTISGGGGGSSTLAGLSDVVITGNADSTFLQYDSTNGVWRNQSLSNALTGGDTTIFQVVLDSTGQQNQRVLFSKNNKISSDNRFLFDDANDKLVIGNTNVSVGGPNTKLWVNGNVNFGANTTTNSLTIGSLTGILKASSGVVGTAVSGTDIKTINGNSILGSGDLLVGGSTSLNNVGTGFDLAQQGTANVKRLAGGFGIKLDSTTTANTVRVSLDTTTQTLTDAATVTFDANLGVSAKVTLTATRTLAFSNFNNGMFLSLLVIQDGTGGWGLNLPAGTEVINGGGGVVTLTTAAASEDILTFWKIGNKIYCNYGKNYN